LAFLVFCTKKWAKSGGCIGRVRSCPKIPRESLYRTIEKRDENIRATSSHFQVTAIRSRIDIVLSFAPKNLTASFASFRGVDATLNASMDLSRTFIDFSFVKDSHGV